MAVTKLDNIQNKQYNDLINKKQVIFTIEDSNTLHIDVWSLTKKGKNNLTRLYTSVRINLKTGKVTNHLLQ